MNENDIPEELREAMENGEAYMAMKKIKGEPIKGESFLITIDQLAIYTAIILQTDAETRRKNPGMEAPSHDMDFLRKMARMTLDVTFKTSAWIQEEESEYDQSQ